MRCPICEVELESKEYATEFGVDEQYDECRNGCSLYHYRFTYGNSLTTIGSVEVHGHYLDSKEDVEFHSKIQKMAIEYERDKLGLSLKTKERESEWK